ncbi:hypothetical protein OESDEN_11900 [Oesophagostomum dentatum]|uniref:Uncharacterized protein n=1 Tax=Oesophagostomum dentatum TaxID=61180 RepID=A0A0B1SSM3_OESDE|nr:hypothetical protein OESDEN_11900 [Oesophagostomum dentatum]
MSLRTALVILVVAVVMALCQALPAEENNLPPDYGSLENFFYLSPRELLTVFLGYVAIHCHLEDKTPTFINCFRTSSQSLGGVFDTRRRMMTNIQCSGFLYLAVVS